MRTTSMECVGTLDGRSVGLDVHPMFPNAWIARPGTGVFTLLYKNTDARRRTATLTLRLDTVEDPEPRIVPAGQETEITMDLTGECQVIGIDRTYPGEETANFTLILNP